MSVWTTDLDQRSQNLRHFHPGMGLQLGYSGFSCNQNSSAAYVLQSEHEDKHTWNAACGLWTHFVSVYLVCKNPNTLNWSSTADNTITQGGIGVLGSPFCGCGLNRSTLHLHYSCDFIGVKVSNLEEKWSPPKQAIYQCLVKFINSSRDLKHNNY